MTLKDPSNAETLLVKASRKVAKTTAAEELHADFEEHPEPARGHVSRLNRMFKSQGENPQLRWSLHASLW